MNRHNALYIIIGLLLMCPTVVHAQLGFDIVSVEAYINDHKQQRSLLLVRSTLSVMARHKEGHTRLRSQNK